MRATLPHTTGTATNDGIDIGWELYGDGDTTIIFLPTWSMVRSRHWKGQIPYFAEHFRCITYDPRGNGNTGRPDTPDGYHIDVVIEDTRAVMDATDTEKAVLVGYSFGSLNAYGFAAKYPDRTLAVVSTAASTPLASHEHRYPGTYDGKTRPEGWAKSHPDWWRKDYRDWVEFFQTELNNEPHSTKQLEDALRWAETGDGDMLAMTVECRDRGFVNEDTYRACQCPNLVIHAENDVITPIEGSRKLAEITGGELVTTPRGGHPIHGRFPAWFNVTMRNFLARELGTWRPEPARNGTRRKRTLYLSSPIGLGHARRDLAVTRELRRLHPDLQVDWLAQDPVTRFLEAHSETIHPASRALANESAHIEEEAGEHDLNAFQAIRSMDEILVKNFMVFQEALEEQKYDLVIADEAWDVDHYWHEHPEMKRAPIAWFTDFVGWVPFSENGPREAYLTADYNAEMIGHVETHPDIRDRAIFVGTEADIANHSFGKDLPHMRDWVPKHYEFSDYIIGQHPSRFGSRQDLRAELGYDDGRKTCIVAVGGSGVGGSLIRRILQAVPAARATISDLRVIVVTGPRLDAAAFNIPEGVETRAFVPDLDRHLAACDLALVQGGLTTCMELAAAGTPFLYFPLRNHFEQNFHVAARLDRYGAGRRMIFSESPPDVIADAMMAELANPRRPAPVASDGAARAARMVAELL